MARLDNKVLFFTTSPRTPSKMIPEIQLLYEKFEGKSWNKVTQEQFIDELASSSFFEGEGDCMTREQAVSWCMKRGYCFVELDMGEIVYTHKGGIKRERIDQSSAALHERQD